MNLVTRRDPFRSEVAALPSENLLVEHRRFKVFTATAEQIPELLDEICRAREIAFRSVGEGTGNEIDRDRFDDHYHHLVLWDDHKGAVAGAYRYVFTDQVRRTLGTEGLYCSTLFLFDPKFLEGLGKAVELGRSFVSPAYQTQHQTLGLLWKGIGQIIVKNPEYHRLFGPVSISRDYTPISQNLIVRYLTRQHLDSDLSPLVKGRNPFAGQEAQPEQVPYTLHEVSAQIAELEPDKKGIPILLKHYLRLNATLLSFNIDPDFSDVLDALLIVDLHEAPPLLMKRYLGKQGYLEFAAKRNFQ